MHITLGYDLLMLVLRIFTLKHMTVKTSSWKDATDTALETAYCCMLRCSVSGSFSSAHELLKHYFSHKHEFCGEDAHHESFSLLI